MGFIIGLVFIFMIVFAVMFIIGVTMGASDIVAQQKRAREQEEYQRRLNRQ